MNQHHTSRRATLLALAAAGTSTSGCFGGFELTNLLYDWNDSFDGKFIKWLMFLVLAILPIYSIAILVDAIVFNSIEFWTGDNPVASKDLPDGYRVASRKLPESDTVRHEITQHGRRVAVLYTEKVNNRQLRLLDERGRVLTRVSQTPEALELEDGSGTTIARMTPTDCDQVQAANRAGLPMRDALVEQLALRGQLHRVSEAAAARGGHTLL